MTTLALVPALKPYEIDQVLGRESDNHLALPFGAVTPRKRLWEVLRS
jgi:hypothetical protein